MASGGMLQCQAAIVTALSILWMHLDQPFAALHRQTDYR